MAKDTLKISASNLGYSECAVEAWLKARGVQFPGFMGSSTLSEIHKKQEETFKKCTSLHALCDQFPDGQVVSSGKYPTTLPFEVEGTSVYLKGHYHHLIKLNNNNDEHVLVTFKTSDPTKNLDAISVQLNANAFILQNHKDHEERVNVVQLGVVVFDPNAFDRGDAFYQFYPVKLDLDTFEDVTLPEYVKKVNPTRMPPYCGCKWCKFISTIETIKTEMVTSK
jgi:hypothetical protein